MFFAIKYCAQCFYIIKDTIILKTNKLRNERTKMLQIGSYARNNVGPFEACGTTRQYSDES